MAQIPYVGRFAPSPSGPLHFGSLVAALGSYLQARVSGGKWLLRIEDLDTPRVVPGAADSIIRTLAAFGFEWDGPIEFQSERIARYEAALQDLQRLELVYRCTCSRAQIASQMPQGALTDEPRYPGTCRNGRARGDAAAALRFRVDSGPIAVDDRLQGAFQQNVAATSGDFVVKRRDGIFAYHLAVVVDDASQGITEIVRGADLLDSTPRHIVLQKALAVPTPAYCHLPLALDSFGHKLSKSLQSLPIDPSGDPAHATGILWQGLAFLKQSPPLELRTAELGAFWSWAQTHWHLDPLYRLKSATAPLPE